MTTIGTVALESDDSADEDYRDEAGSDDDASSRDSDDGGGSSSTIDLKSRNEEAGKKDEETVKGDQLVAKEQKKAKKKSKKKKLKSKRKKEQEAERARRMEEQIQTARVEKIFEEMVQESVEAESHHDSLKPDRFMLQFQRRDLEPRRKQNTTLDELAHHINISVAQIANDHDKPLDVRGLKKRVREESANDSFECVAERALEAVALGGDVVVERDVRYAGKVVKIQQTMQRDSKKYSNFLRAEAAKNRTLGGQFGELDNLVAKMRAEQSVTSVEKSQADWDVFKEAHNLEDELRKNRRDGFLSKQVFLANTGYKQWEKNLEEKRHISEQMELAKKSQK